MKETIHWVGALMSPYADPNLLQIAAAHEDDRSIDEVVEHEAAVITGRPTKNININKRYGIHSTEDPS